MINAPAELTVVIPVYNREKGLAEVLESIRAQTARGFRLIIVDNGSTDGSRAVAEEWGRRNADIPTLVLDEAARGAARARNRGLEAVETPWTMFFDSDDLMYPGHIAGLMKAIEARPEVDIWGWDVDYEGYARAKGIFADPPTQWTNMMNGTFATQRYAARTSLLRRVGGWNAEVGLWDDIELGARLLAAGPVIAKLPASHRSLLQRFTTDSITGVSFISQAARMEPALERMERTLGASQRFLADVKRAQYYGCAAREGSAEAAENMRALLGRTSGWRRRMALRFLYTTVRLGLRGTYLFLKPFYGKK